MTKHPAKLLLLSQLFYPELISTGQTLTELCEALVGLGVDIEVFCGPPTIVDRVTKIPKHIVYKEIKINRLWGTRFPKLSFLGKLLNQLTFTFSAFIKLIFDTSRRTILVVSNPPFLTIVCAILRIFGGKPYIALLFDIYPDVAVKLDVLKENSIIKKAWDSLNRFMFNNASFIVILGRCMKETIKRKGISEEKIRIIHVWSDDKLIQGNLRVNNPFKEKWGLENKFVVSYSGNMGRFHDMETIMEAAKMLKDKTGIVFLFVGEGQKKRWMQEIAKKWQLTNCRFYSYVAKEDLGYMLTCADVGLVSLSKGVEGLSVPSKFYGVLSAEVPVIAIMSEGSEPALVVKENNCGFVIEPGNAGELVRSIFCLYNNRELYKTFARNSRNVIDKEYNLKEAAGQYFSLIKLVQDHFN